MHEEIKIPNSHPRAESLKARERLIKYYKMGLVSTAGLIAHGRGEAFDYLLGEKTTEQALKAITAAAATLLTAKHPVISVNGNTTALVAEHIVKLAEVVNAKLEVNLFYRSVKRELAIQKVLKENGAKDVLGVGEAACAKIPELGSERRHVDPRGILVADVVLVPLEDGDRTEALVRMGKKVVAIDLNPLSRTAQFASITIVDNIQRAIPAMIQVANEFKKKDETSLQKIASAYNNREVLGEAISLINKRLSKLAEKGIYIPLLENSKIQNGSENNDIQ